VQPILAKARGAREEAGVRVKAEARIENLTTRGSLPAPTTHSARRTTCNLPEEVRGRIKSPGRAREASRWTGASEEEVQEGGEAAAEEPTP